MLMSALDTARVLLDVAAEWTRLGLDTAGGLLETAIAPEWAKLGQLAAIAAIRTALNYFLSREIADERNEVTRAAA
jgi:uncharacterized membrane protein